MREEIIFAEMIDDVIAVIRPLKLHSTLFHIVISLDSTIHRCEGEIFSFPFLRSRFHSMNQKAIQI